MKLNSMIREYIKRFFGGEETPTIDTSTDSPDLPRNPIIIDKRKLDTPIHVFPQDTITATIETFGKPDVVVKTEIKTKMVVDGVTLFKFEDALGMEYGFGAVFGKLKE